MNKLLMALCVAGFSWSAWAAVWAVTAPFTLNVHVDGSENPTLVFGVGAAEKAPMPPFSGMFGVKDLYFYDGAGADPDMKRLSVDRRAGTADSESWVLCVPNANASLEFRIGDVDAGTAPVLYYTSRHIDKKTGEAVTASYQDADGNYNTVAAGGTLAVKAGYTYLITTAAVNSMTAEEQNRFTDAALPAADDRNEINVVRNDEKVYQGSRAYDLVQGQEYSLAFAPDSNEVMVKKGEKHYLLSAAGSAQEKTPEEAAAYKGWHCDVSGTDISCDFTGGEALAFSVTANGASSRLELVMESNKGGCKVMSTYLIPAGERVSDVANWIRRNVGTLDFDQNGILDVNDYYYFYNFVNNGCPGPEDDWFTAADLKPYTTDDVTESDCRTALQTLQENVDDLVFIALDPANVSQGTAKLKPTVNDVSALYNYQNGGYWNPEAEEEWGAGWGDLTPYQVEGTQDGYYQEALEMFYDYRE